MIYPTVFVTLTCGNRLIPIKIGWSSDNLVVLEVSSIKPQYEEKGMFGLLSSYSSQAFTATYIRIARGQAALPTFYNNLLYLGRDITGFK